MCEPGDVAPDFALKDVNGNDHKLSSHRGKKVMLCFNRYAACPLCRMDIDNLERRQEVFDKAGIDIICVFPSPPLSIKRYLMRNDNPFTLLTDPDEMSYENFEVGTSCFAASGSLMGVGWVKGFQASRKGFKVPPLSEIYGSSSRLPAEFLIDEAGKIVDVFRARTLDQFMPWYRIEAFMPIECRFPKKKSRLGLRGRKRPSDAEDMGIYMGGDDDEETIPED